MQGRSERENLGRLIAAIKSLGADLDLAVVLRRLTEAAADLVGATYGALGVLSDDRSHLSSFITVGMTPEEEEPIGELPKGHGILGLLIVDPRPLRLDDLRDHPESFGFPDHHPQMTSFLGVPVLVRNEVFGNLYLTDKRGGERFTDVDEELAIGLAAAAGVAIENARLLDRTRELDIVHERERIARDLHDTVIQRLFATGLSLQTAARLAHEPAVMDRIQQAVDELDLTVRDIRSSIFELNPPPTASNGLRRQLLSVGDDLADALGFSPTFRFEGPVDSAVPDHLAQHLVAVCREGLTNVAKHAGSPTAEVRLSVAGGEVRLVVEDAGRGVAERRAGGHGLENFARRADEVGGQVELSDRPSGGTVLSWRAPILD